MKKIKLIVLVLLIVLLIIILFYEIFGTNLSYLSSREIKENRILNTNLITQLKINNVDAIYEKNTNTFYYTIPSKYENNLYILNLNLEDGFKYKIIDETLNIIKVNYTKEINVIIYNDKYYFETKIQLTNLPLINILSEDEITSNDTKTQFNYFNNTNTKKTINLNSLINIRGSTSKWFDKKSYKINFTNKSYTDEKDINIENFYNGDSLILDAVYRDPSKIRNVLCIELWNNISNDFSNVNIYSEFVELFINNEYKGLYVLTEPINRTKLNLNKTSSNDTSVIVKSSVWGKILNIREYYKIGENEYLYYELKYPNDKNMYEKSWNIVLNKLSKYYNNVDLYDVIKNSFNIENYIDMIIFNAFTNNVDNKIEKNNYFYINSLTDPQLFIQPWDMEYTYGLLFAENMFNNFIKKEDYKIIYTKFYHTNSSEINKLLIERYWELRENILTIDFFDSLLGKYLDELTKGAASRDSEKWYEYDIEKEIEEIRSWIYNRIEFFDEYVESIENEKS
ncbi:MAG: CotH kinase family protein [Bacilli bacterium]|nr:CotH kinase family protein [Bacilli bacterium]